MIGTIEAKMIETVQAAPLGYTLKKVASYGGEFSQGIEKHVHIFPAILFVFNGLKPANTTRDSSKWSAEWLIIICAKSLRNEAESRRGSNDRVGSYQMVEDVIQILRGKTLELDISPVKFGTTTALLNDRSENQLASVYGISCSTEFDLGDVEPINPRPGVFQTFHGNWDIPVHGNVSKDLPADSTSDATDHVTLEQ